MERSIDGQLCQEFVYQKLLKFGNSSSSYGKKNLVCFFMPHIVVVVVVMLVVVVSCVTSVLH